MTLNPAGIQGLDDARQFVQHAICELNGLEAASAPMTERVLLRGGLPCGIFFCVQGPRSVTFTAIWAQDQNTVLFYDSAGQRLHQTKLSPNHVVNKRLHRRAA
jgi:hypothetical protein